MAASPKPHDRATVLEFCRQVDEHKVYLRERIRHDTSNIKDASFIKKYFRRNRVEEEGRAKEFDRFSR